MPWLFLPCWDYGDFTRCKSDPEGFKPSTCSIGPSSGFTSMSSLTIALSARVCAQARGRVFPSFLVGKKGFSPLEQRCKGTAHCQGYLIGLYGGWMEAREVVARLQQISKKTVLRLSCEELCAVVKGEWNKSVSADTDRINVHMLEGLCFEKDDMTLAIAGYRYVIERAKETRHRSLVVPAYLRLIGLLLRSGSEDEARQTIQQFEKRFPPNQSDEGAPTTLQRNALEEIKSLLWESQSLQVSA